jgi:hypothetical protein
MFIENEKWKTIIIGENNYATYGLQLHSKQWCLTVSICHMGKINLKTLESKKCNWKNYSADTRFVPPIDRRIFPPIGGAFFRIQDGSKPIRGNVPRDTFYL